MMNRELGSIPVKYLGMPISARALMMAEFEPIVDKVSGRLEPWQGKLLAYGIVLSSSTIVLPTYPCLSWVFMFSGMGFMRNLIKCGLDFFGEAKEHERQKYHMGNYETVCSPKEVGRLRIINSKIMN